jgi:hypothetical protein
MLFFSSVPYTNVLYITLQLLPSIVAASSINPSAIQWVDCAQNVPTYFSVVNVTIDTTDLPSTLHCGEIVVPMNYREPISAQNNITLSLAMHRPVNPLGVIF